MSRSRYRGGAFDRGDYYYGSAFHNNSYDFYNMGAAEQEQYYASSWTEEGHDYQDAYNYPDAYEIPGTRDNNESQRSETAYGRMHDHRQTLHATERTHSPRHHVHSMQRNGMHTRIYAAPPLVNSPPPFVSRSRTATPPSAPPSEPSSSYLSTSLLPSQHIESPASSRKLLVLDLNGTLLIRAKHQNQQGQRAVHQLQRFRAVHPRPYMPAFRSYLFAPETKAWLDVMVWSSAKPHSVEDMVKHCFGEEKRKLVAIWARDTLGLSRDDYNRKTQTSKDLTKPWSKLPELLGSNREKRTSGAYGGEGSRVHRASEEPIHSAKTTLLLDDSPLKALLQPYNHVCIKEYAADLRAKDLEIISRESARLKAEKDSDRRDASDGISSSDLSAETEGTGKKRKRKAKAKAKLKAAALEASTDDKVYDETLLAIIGILDAIKQESNVASWLRAGGLWGPAGVPSKESPTVGGRVTEEGDVTGGNVADDTQVPGGPVDENVDFQGAPRQAAMEESRTERRVRPKDKRKKKIDNSAAHQVEEGSALATAVVSTGDSEASTSGVAEAGGKKRRGKRQKFREASTKPVAEGEGEIGPAGNDKVTTTETPISKDVQGGMSTSTGAFVTPGSPTPIQSPDNKMWFDAPETVDYWIDRGRRAVEGLGIEVLPGIER